MDIRRKDEKTIFNEKYWINNRSSSSFETFGRNNSYTFPFKIGRYSRNKFIWKINIFSWIYIRKYFVYHSRSIFNSRKEKSQRNLSFQYIVFLCCDSASGNDNNCGGDDSFYNTFYIALYYKEYKKIFFRNLIHKIKKYIKKYEKNFKKDIFERKKS